MIKDNSIFFKIESWWMNTQFMKYKTPFVNFYYLRNKISGPTDSLNLLA
jgi:hypothetical protein